MFIPEILAEERILSGVTHFASYLNIYLNAASEMISQLSERLPRRIPVGILKDRLHRYGDRLTSDNRTERTLSTKSNAARRNPPLYLLFIHMHLYENIN